MTNFGSHEVPVSRCFECGDPLGMATHALPGDQGGPQPGDLTCCWNCGAISRFNPDMSLRAATDEDLLDPELPVEVRHLLLKAQADIQQRGRLRRTKRQVDENGL